MFRLAQKHLVKWRNKAGRKPIIVRGARQVGKSWLIKEHGKEYKKYIEINFEENKEYIDLFGKNINPTELVKKINNYFNVKIEPGHTLIFLDEIQLCPRAISALRFFYEKMPELHIIAAGSLLEFELEKISIPVGRIEFLYLKPLSFFEYLKALNYSSLSQELLENENRPLNKAIHQKLLGIFRDYTLVGGMPEAVETYVRENENIREVQIIHSQLIDTYQADFQKYAKEKQIKYLNLLLKSLPLNLGKKIKYSNLTKDVRGIYLAEAIDLLEKSGLIYRIYHSDCNGFPIGSELNLKKFKIIFLDVGLTNHLLGLDVKPYLLNEDIHQINNGAVAESVVGQELISYPHFYKRKELSYWHREDGSSNAEVDFVIEHNAHVVPIEVKDGAHGRMRSLFSFFERKNPDFGLRVSKNNHSYFEKVQSIPFYSIMELFREEIVDYL